MGSVLALESVACDASCKAGIWWQTSIAAGSAQAGLGLPRSSLGKVTRPVREWSVEDKRKTG